ncbi:MaoC/PaaZ C-terminal domain-containing protein [Burkholderia lata]|uniref:Nodulation protein NodN n=1 Tax=Burkholderia lata (strain ATCC 17760 / DSM 23089 / LMG 22485 / NCIMB 9086 / R18194 / 383) TaxID=482957 RepID=A0A6P2X3Y2_BURL3|nr:MaoC/PaaZ C-terminal domain-containing protein [Burkholderia lata]VWD03747.1 nodulation protein NodN [Burkholderia lata]
MRDESGTAARKPDRDPGHTADGRRHASTRRALSRLATLVDKELGVSGWLSIDQPSIDEIVDFTRDRKSVYVDEDLARATPSGEAIVHGFLALSMLYEWASNALPEVKRQQNAINGELSSVRFITPVRRGERVRGRFTLKQVTVRSTTSIQLTVGATVEIESHHKPAIVAEWTIPVNA